MRIGGVFDIETIEECFGFVSFQVSGKDAIVAFKDEAGGHRWQRVSPTEKRGRIHTSTVTVAVLPVPDSSEIHVEDRDLEWSVARGSGPGGQHRNKTESAVRLFHKPSQIVVCCESERRQHRNKQMALDVLRARLKEKADNQQAQSRNDARRGQVGSGMRGDKIRTVALQRGIVTYHATGRKVSTRLYLRGMIE
jgi:peptide chain release factor 1